MVLVPPGPAGLKFWRPDDRTSGAAAAGIIVAADEGSYLLDGADAPVLHQWICVATTPSSYALTGTDAALSTGIAPPRQFIVSSYPFPVFVNETGTRQYAVSGVYFNETGRPQRVSKTLAADAASYSLTGVDATLIKRVSKAVVAGVGSYTVTGTTASLLHKWMVSAGSGSYALTGVTATLRTSTEVVEPRQFIVSSYPFPVFVNETGTRQYVVSGVYLNETGRPRVSKILAAGGGSYAITGTAASLLHKGIAAAAAGSYSLAGTDAGIRHVWKVAAASGAYSLTGAQVTVPHSWKLSAASGSYGLTGADAVLKRISGKFVSADPGSYTLAGSATSVLVSRKLVGAAGSYALTGTAANIVYDTGEVEPPILVDGGGIARPPQPYPVVGIGYGLLPPIEGEAFGVVVAAAAAGQSRLARFTGQATGSIGATGSVAGRFTIKAAAGGQCVRLGKGFGMIKFEGAAVGRYDDDEAAAVTFLLAA